jgi:hypothetical protein
VHPFLDGRTADFLAVKFNPKLFGCIAYADGKYSLHAVEAVFQHKDTV